MNNTFTVLDYIRERRMRRHSLKWFYCCSGDIYKLLGTKTLINLTKRIERGTVKIDSKILYKKGRITLEENFISILDKYISYIKDNYHIRHTELPLVIEESLKNKYNDCLFFNVYYHDSYDTFIKQFKKLFLFNLVDNIEYYSFLDTLNDYKEIQKANKFLKNKNLSNEKDLEKIEDFFIKVLNQRKDNLYHLFIPYKEIKERNISFCMEQVEWILEDYYNKT